MIELYQFFNAKGMNFLKIVNRMVRILAFLLAAAMLTGCAARPSEQPQETTVTFTDDLGREIRIAPPQRTACLLGSFAHVWLLAGGTVCATADDAWEDFHLELPEETVNLGGTENLSLELLLAAEPDLVIASSRRRQNMEWKDTLESMGIPVAYFEVTDFEDYLRMLDICTELTGCKENYERYGLAVQQQIGAVVEQSKLRLENSAAPTVLTLRACYSLFSPLYQDLQNRAITTGDRATALSMNAVIHDGLGIFLNLVFGSVAQMNINGAFGFGAVLCLAGWGLFRKSRR